MDPAWQSKNCISGERDIRWSPTDQPGGCGSFSGRSFVLIAFHSSQAAVIHRSALSSCLIDHHETTTLLQPPTFQCATTSAPLHTHSLPLAATAPSCEQGRVRKFAHLNLSRTQGKQHFSNSVKIGKTPKHAKSLRKQHFVF